MCDVGLARRTRWLVVVLDTTGGPPDDHPTNDIDAAEIVPCAYARRELSRERFLEIISDLGAAA